MDAKSRIDHTHACQSCCQPFSHPYGEAPVPSFRLWSIYIIQLTVALLTGRKADLNSDIKEKFVKLCEEHGIIKENIIDLTKTSKSGFIYFSHPEYFIIEETNPVGYQSFVEHWRVLSFLWRK